MAGDGTPAPGRQASRSPRMRPAIACAFCSADDSEDRPSPGGLCERIGARLRARARPSTGAPNVVLAEAGTGVGKTLGYNRTLRSLGRRREQGPGLDQHLHPAICSIRSTANWIASTANPALKAEKVVHPQRPRELSLAS